MKHMVQVHNNAITGRVNCFLGYWYHYMQIFNLSLSKITLICHDFTATNKIPNMINLIKKSANTNMI